MADIVELLCYILNGLKSGSCPYTSGDPLLDVLLYLLILPTIILIIFLNSAANIFLQGKTKWSLLLSMVFYLVIIQQGWYMVFVEFTKSYVLIFLILAGAVFFIGRIIRPGHVKMAKGLGSSLKGMSKSSKRKRRKEIEIELKRINKEIERVAKFLRNHEKDRKREEYLTELTRNRTDLEAEKEKLER